MKTGKLDWSSMSKLLSLLPSAEEDVIVGPAQGEDAAVIRVRDGFLVIHTDPITTGVRKIGYLAINVAGNDIAVRGVAPKWFLATILLPERFEYELVEEIFADMSTALKEIKGVMIGGHTEVSPGLERPIINVTAAGYTLKKPLFTRDARPGDILYAVGRIGGEGAGVIAWDFTEQLRSLGVDEKDIETAKGFIYDVSVINVALGIRDVITTMHDATEGGLLQAVREIAVASGTKAVLEIDDSMLDPIVVKITRVLGIDPLRLLSSGCVVASVSPENTMELETILEKIKKPYYRIGRLEKGDGEVVVKYRDMTSAIREDIVDEIYKLWRQ